MLTPMQVGQKVVELTKQHKAMEAINTLYSANIISIEPPGNPSGHQRAEGIAAVREKTEWWINNHDVHSFEANGPWPHGDRFIAYFKYDITAKTGPMAGKRFTMEETGLYTVKNGKVTQEEFFYNMGG